MKIIALFALATLAPTVSVVHAADPINHRARQERPIQLGVSGGSIVDHTSFGCCSGTLGSLVKDSQGTLYILSNTHVLAGDTSPGGNNRISEPGDPVNQPGFIDIQCQEIPPDYVATLTNWAPIVPDGISTVDAAIAKTDASRVDGQGKILEIGAISSTPKSAYIGQKVKKSGRTSGLTKGEISALGVTVDVEYTDECGGTPYKTRFENQILISSGTFLRGGDSGSLLVEDVCKNPRPIGLLFAGSSNSAFANPINDVLQALNISFVGTPTAASSLDKNELLATNAISHALSVKNLLADELFKIEGVVGHAVGLAKKHSQKPTILILVEKKTKNLRKTLPKKLGGIPVKALEVGKVKAF